MSDQKPVDSAQIVLDKKDQSAPSGGNASATYAASKCASGGMGCLALKVLAVLFVVGNVTALYVLHFVNRPSPTTRFSFSSFASNAGTKASVGVAVSLSSASKLRNGAGTTAYLARATLVDKDISYYEYINMAKMGASSNYYTTNLMSYRRITAAGGKESVLTTFTVDPSAKTATITADYDTATNVVAKDAIRGIVTLSDTRALVVTVDDATFNYKTYIMPATIDKSKATLAQGKKVKVTDDSVTNYATKLSATAAVLAYYGAYVTQQDYFQFVKVASVAADGTITLSAAKQFGPANNDITSTTTTFGKPVMLATTAGAFAIPYYLSTSDDTHKNLETGLCVTMATYASSSNTIGASTTGVCNTKFRPKSYPDAIMISDSVMLIAFHDSNNNNALTLATVHITATTAHFRSAYVFSEVGGDFVYGAQWGFDAELSMALLSGNRVAVSFLNPSMDGKQSVKVVKFSTETLAIQDVTPVLPVAAASFTLDLMGGSTNKAVTQQVLAVDADSVIAMHMGKRGDTAYQHVALVEVYGSPIGLLRKYDGKKDASVAISGKATEVSTFGNADMVVGKFYYATTAGYVVSPDASATPTDGEYFIASEDAKILVTADSKVGVAIGDETLFVSTKL